MADETPDKNPSDPEASSGDGHHRPAIGSFPMDMSLFEAQFGTPSPGQPDHQPDHDGHRTGLPAQRPPDVEWAIRWADGGLTRVHSEAAARAVAGGYSRCTVVRRIVGQWGAA
jgi:hypothetical protein